MPEAGKALATLAFSIALGTVPVLGAPAAHANVGSCGGGDFRWTAVNGGITMQPQFLTFTSVGRLWDCVGATGITGGTFTGVHTAWSDCMHPADGPITVTIVWSNGESSTLAGPWPVGMMQPAVGPLEVVAGLGQGSRAQISATYEMGTPDQVMGCMGSGIPTGVGHLSATIL
ncbi:hypothetical protein [Nocardia inohanensis]|uniref:hypothetical protein n=1 Tax=Nocardia inohanensis TaxID=209246 RepID=UPI0008331409|nr:hypothetical protein [Nocardia inohanensis]